VANILSPFGNPATERLPGLQAMNALTVALTAACLSFALGGFGPQSKPSEFAFLVVDGRSGEPIADAEVRWAEDVWERPADASLLDRLESQHVRSMQDFCDRERLANASGRIARSGPDGRVVLPTSSAPILLARKGPLLGGTDCLRWNESSSLSTLSLWPDGDLCVRVLDSSGRPAADVTVLLVASDEQNPPGWVQQRSTSMADGVAVIQHGFVTVAAGAPSSGLKDPAWRVAVGTIPSTAGVFAIDPRNLPREPITVRLPPTGDVEIAMRTLEGQSAALDLPLILAAADSGASSAGVTDVRTPRLGGSSRPDEMSAQVVDGKVVFRNIGLGQHLIASASRHSRLRVSVIRFDGPTEPGQLVQQTLVLGAGGVTFTGRALDAEGKPICNAEMRVELLSGPSPNRHQFSNSSPKDPLTHGRAVFKSGRQGEFAIDYDQEQAEGGPPLLLLSNSRENAATLEKLIDVKEQWIVGSHALGDVRLPVAPIYAAGVVVDASGDPILGAQVCEPHGNIRIGIYGETDERGRFELRSATPFSTVCLSVSKQGFADLSGCQGETGRTDWHLVLERACKIVARFKLPVGANPRDFQVNIDQTEHHGSGSAWNHRGGMGKDARLVWDTCQPGTYTLTVPPSRKNGTKRVRVTDIVVRAGETTDVGLIEISLR